MKLFALFFIPNICLFFLQSCDSNESTETKKPVTYGEIYAPGNDDKTQGYLYDSVDTKGERGGEIYTYFDCPDSKFFPPIDIKTWDKTPVVNGRLPTYEETLNGMSIHHYGEKENAYVKPYPMTLPKLASIYKSSTGKNEIVLVIQIVQTYKDTVVGYRYFSGGCGGSLFRDFHFLTVPEIQNFTSY